MCCFSQLTQTLLPDKPACRGTLSVFLGSAEKRKKKKKVGSISEYFKLLILMQASHIEDTSWMGKPEEVCLWSCNTVQRRNFSEKCRTLNSLLFPVSLHPCLNCSVSPSGKHNASISSSIAILRHSNAQ